MHVPYDIEIHRPPAPPGGDSQTNLGTAGFNVLTPTSLKEGGPREPGWREMVELLIDEMPAYAVLVILDGSPNSAAVREAIAARYVEIDRVTGEHLVVLSTVSPPDGWYPLGVDRHRRPSAVAREMSWEEAVRIQTPHEELRARYNEAALAGELFRDYLSPPCLCFLVSRVTNIESKEAEIEALAYDISGFQTGDRLVSLFRTLGDLASEKALYTSDAFDLAHHAFSWTNPSSLRWRNVAWKTMRILPFLEAWVKRAGLLGTFKAKPSDDQ